MGNIGSRDQDLSFKVVGVKPQSPGEKAGLQINEDFILSVDGNYLVKMSVEDIKDFIKSHEDKPVQVCVFNEPRHIVRIVKLTPTQNWPGSGLLGISIARKRFSYGTEVDEEDKAHRRASGEVDYLDIYGGGDDAEVELGASSSRASTSTRNSTLRRSSTTSNPPGRNGASRRASMRRSISEMAQQAQREAAASPSPLSSTSGVLLDYQHDSPLRRAAAASSSSSSSSASAAQSPNSTPQKRSSSSPVKKPSGDLLDDGGEREGGSGGGGGKVHKTRFYRVSRSFYRTMGLLPPKEPKSPQQTRETQERQEMPIGSSQDSTLAASRDTAVSVSPDAVKKVDHKDPKSAKPESKTEREFGSDVPLGGAAFISSAADTDHEF